MSICTPSEGRIPRLSHLPAETLGSISEYLDLYTLQALLSTGDRVLIKRLQCESGVRHIRFVLPPGAKASDRIAYLQSRFRGTISFTIKMTLLDAHEMVPLSPVAPDKADVSKYEFGWRSGALEQMTLQNTIEMIFPSSLTKLTLISTPFVFLQPNIRLGDIAQGAPNLTYLDVRSFGKVYFDPTLPVLPLLRVLKVSKKASFHDSTSDTDLISAFFGCLPACVEEISHYSVLKIGSKCRWWSSIKRAVLDDAQDGLTFPPNLVSLKIEPTRNTLPSAFPPTLTKLKIRSICELPISIPPRIVSLTVPYTCNQAAFPPSLTSLSLEGWPGNQPITASNLPSCPLVVTINGLPCVRFPKSLIRPNTPEIPKWLDWNFIRRHDFVEGIEYLSSIGTLPIQDIVRNVSGAKPPLRVLKWLLHRSDLLVDANAGDAFTTFFDAIMRFPHDEQDLYFDLFHRCFPNCGPIPASQGVLPTNYLPCVKSWCRHERGNYATLKEALQTFVHVGQFECLKLCLEHCRKRRLRSRVIRVELSQLIHFLWESSNVSSPLIRTLEIAFASTLNQANPSHQAWINPFNFKFIAGTAFQVSSPRNLARLDRDCYSPRASSSLHAHLIAKSISSNMNQLDELWRFLKTLVLVDSAIISDADLLSVVQPLVSRKDFILGELVDLLEVKGLLTSYVDSPGTIFHIAAMNRIDDNLERLSKYPGKVWLTTNREDISAFDMLVMSAPPTSVRGKSAYDKIVESVKTEMSRQLVLTLAGDFSGSVNTSYLYIPFKGVDLSSGMKLPFQLCSIVGMPQYADLSCEQLRWYQMGNSPSPSLLHLPPDIIIGISKVVEIGEFDTLEHLQSKIQTSPIPRIEVFVSLRNLVINFLSGIYQTKALLKTLELAFSATLDGHNSVPTKAITFKFANTPARSNPLLQYPTWTNTNQLDELWRFLKTLVLVDSAILSDADLLSVMRPLVSRKDFILGELVDLLEVKGLLTFDVDSPGTIFHIAAMNRIDDNLERLSKYPGKVWLKTNHEDISAFDMLVMSAPPTSVRGKSAYDMIVEACKIETSRQLALVCGKDSPSESRLIGYQPKTDLEITDQGPSVHFQLSSITGMPQYADLSCEQVRWCQMGNSPLLTSPVLAKLVEIGEFDTLEWVLHSSSHIKPENQLVFVSLNNLVVNFMSGVYETKTLLKTLELAFPTLEHQFNTFQLGSDRAPPTNPIIFKFSIANIRPTFVTAMYLPQWEWSTSNMNQLDELWRFLKTLVLVDSAIISDAGLLSVIRPLVSRKDFILGELVDLLEVKGLLTSYVDSPGTIFHVAAMNRSDDNLERLSKYPGKVWLKTNREDISAFDMLVMSAPPTSVRGKSAYDKIVESVKTEMSRHIAQVSSGSLAVDDSPPDPIFYAPTAYCEILPHGVSVACKLASIVAATQFSALSCEQLRWWQMNHSTQDIPSATFIAKLVEIGELDSLKSIVSNVQHSPPGFQLQAFASLNKVLCNFRSGIYEARTLLKALAFAFSPAFGNVSHGPLRFTFRYHTSRSKSTGNGVDVPRFWNFLHRLKSNDGDFYLQSYERLLVGELLDGKLTSIDVLHMINSTGIELHQTIEGEMTDGVAKGSTLLHFLAQRPTSDLLEALAMRSDLVWTASNSEGKTPLYHLQCELPIFSSDPAAMQNYYRILEKAETLEQIEYSFQET